MSEQRMVTEIEHYMAAVSRLRTENERLREALRRVRFQLEASQSGPMHPSWRTSLLANIAAALEEVEDAGRTDTAE